MIRYIEDKIGVRLERFYQFMSSELQGYPGRLNMVLRTMLSCALVVVISMTLQVPFLALSLIVVFYVTQSNVVLSRMVGVLFFVGATLAIGASIILLKFTYGYPLARILGACALFFVSTYLMRVTTVGVVFFIVGIVIIYVQTFADATDQAELVLRSVLWVWVAITYAIGLTLLVNTLLLPVEPFSQLERFLRKQLDTIAEALKDTGQGVWLTPAAIQKNVLAGQQLLRFACMRDAACRRKQAAYLARINSICRLQMLTMQLPEISRRPPESSDIRVAVLDLKSTVLDGAVPESLSRLSRLDTRLLPSVYEEIRLVLLSIQPTDEEVPQQTRGNQKSGVLVADAFRNPIYVQFALKTLLAALICYVFYMATDWQGIHTIMLTCLIVAQPSLGATGMRAVLRLGGAIVGSALALAMVVGVVPRIDGIVGLLFMTLPVIALGAWVAAGSERISYAGIQIVFTFSLALLEQFEPSTNLTAIRDRLIGIVLGVLISIVIHAVLWPEAEGDTLRRKIAQLLTRVSQEMRAKRPSINASHKLGVWNELAGSEAVLARVALEPGWQAGETHQEMLIYHFQSMISNARYIIMAVDALQVEASHERLGASDEQLLADIVDKAAGVLDGYILEFERFEALTDQSGTLSDLQRQAGQLQDDMVRRRAVDLLSCLKFF